MMENKPREMSVMVSNEGWCGSNEKERSGEQ